MILHWFLLTQRFSSGFTTLRWESSISHLVPPPPPSSRPKKGRLRRKVAIGLRVNWHRCSGALASTNFFPTPNSLAFPSKIAPSLLKITGNNNVHIRRAMFSWMNRFWSQLRISCSAPSRSLPTQTRTAVIQTTARRRLWIFGCADRKGDALEISLTLRRAKDQSQWRTKSFSPKDSPSRN